MGAQMAVHQRRCLRSDELGMEEYGGRDDIAIGHFNETVQTA